MSMHKSPKISITLAAAVLTVVALAACTTTDAPAPTSAPATAKAASSGAAVFPTSEVSSLVEDMPQRTVKDLPAARLADGLIPPTNRWFSGLVFGEESMPVFPLPLSFQLTDSGFAFGLPEVSADTNVIRGGFTGQIGVRIDASEGNLDQEVTAYDEASVTVSQSSDGSELGRTVIAQGSPFVSFTAATDVAVSMPTAFTETGDGLWTADVAGSTYGLVSAGTLSAGTDLSLEAGQSVTWFALPEGGELETFAEAAVHPVVGTSVEYRTDAESATTTIHYDTSDGGDTLVAAMPHQLAGLADDVDCGEGEYLSIYGGLSVCPGTSLSWSVPTIAPSGALDLTGLGDDERQRLADQVRSDVAATKTFAADTYFGGKSLYRAANLLEVARQVGADDAVTELTDRLTKALDQWMDPDGCVDGTERCFVYDPDAKGLVGLATSFGSEEFNDHHFHYGYFFYAAAVVAADDPEAVGRWAPVMNLLAADLATSGGSDFFPDRRVFDAYAGHSWASGTSPFGDGNNQESSSEAVTAWNGLALWGDVSGQADLATEAEWMLSSEAASSRAYWTDFDLADPVYEGFEHTVTSLVWGGKRDYATWFSAEPSAMLGILVLPMSPVAGYLGGDPDRVQANLADALPTGGVDADRYDVMFGDYLLMYAALQGPEAASAALADAESLPEERIDDGNSRAYLLAWLMRWGSPPAG